MITENAVYSDEVTIEAPVELVWKILLDFDNYDQWNSFCPRVINDSLEIGSPVDMMVDLGNGPSRQVEYITYVEPNTCIAWGMANKPEDPIHAVRSQTLKRLHDTACTYQTVDEFAGAEVATMMEHFAGPVETGFNRCAYDLKAHAENTFQATY